MIYEYEGFNILSNVVSKYINAAENGKDAILSGADEFVKDLRKLTKPISEIKKPGYTHLIDTFAREIRDKEIVVGWGKYYGRMVENGTSKMAAREHLKPVFEKNKEKYYKTMLNTLGIKTWN